jgi:hypothetical protein
MPTGRGAGVRSLGGAKCSFSLHHHCVSTGSGTNLLSSGHEGLFLLQ